MKRSTPTQDSLFNGQEEPAPSKPADQAPSPGTDASAQTLSRAEVWGKERYFAEELGIQRSPVNREEVRHVAGVLTRMWTAPAGLDPDGQSHEARAMQEGPTAQDDEPPHTTTSSGASDEASGEATEVLLGGEPPDEALDDDLTPLVAAEAAHDLVGKVLSRRYRLGERIGQGVSHVWLATDTHVDQPRAVKAVVGKRRAVRLRREVHFGTICQGIPGLLRVLDHGQDSVQEIAWMVMDYLDGVTLGQRVDQGGVLGWEEAVRIGRQVAETLAAMHARHVIHRDIKPANLFLGRTGEVWVLDLGIAKGIGRKQITENGRQLLGTVPFLAPEQYLTPADVDVRADVYALGLVLCYALGGDAALPPDEPVSSYDELVSRRPNLGDVMPSLPKAVVDVVEKACHPDPAQRYQTMAEFLRALIELLEAPKRAAEAAERARVAALEAELQAKREAAAEQTRKDVRMQRVLRRYRWALVSAGVAVTVFGLVKAWSYREPPEWVLAQERQKHSLTASAATLYETAATKSEALRYQAEQEKQRLRQTNQAKQSGEQVALDARKVFRDGGSVPYQVIEQYPGHIRRAFHDVARAASSLAQLHNLEPVARALDRIYNCNTHVAYLDQVARSPFAVRAPLADVYSKLMDKPDALTRAEQDRYFDELRRTHQSDILLGALVLAGRVKEDPTEYRKLAEATGDPWFIIHGMHEQALFEHRQGRDIEAHNLLVNARRACEDEKIDYRCIEIDLSLAYVARVQNDLINAEGYAQRGWALARKTGSWQIEQAFIGELRSLASLKGDNAAVEAYFQELRERNPSNCEQELAERVARAATYMTTLNFPAAQREMLDAPHCGQPLKLNHMYILAHLDRINLPVIDFAHLRIQIADTRARGDLSPGEHLRLNQIEGTLLLGHNRSEAQIQLRSVIDATKNLPRWDINARIARAIAFEELTLDAARLGEFEAALQIANEAMDKATVKDCVLAAIFSYEGLAFLTASMDGNVRGTFIRSSDPRAEVRRLVFSEMDAGFRGCNRIAVLSSPYLSGDPSLIPLESIWSYRTLRRNRLPPPVAREIRIADVVPQRFGGGLMRATPTIFETHTWRIADGKLVAAPSELDGSYVIDPMQLAQHDLNSNLIVIWHSADSDQWKNIPSSYVEAGVRGVLAVGMSANRASVREFTVRAVARMQAGETLAEAVHNERIQWLKDNSNDQWAKEIIVHE